MLATILLVAMIIAMVTIVVFPLMRLLEKAKRRFYHLGLFGSYISAFVVTTTLMWALKKVVGPTYGLSVQTASTLIYIEWIIVIVGLIIVTIGCIKGPKVASTT